jgi:glycosyltransferase involved in cell wall biosynthesis
MNVVVTTEARFDRTPDGQVWTSGSLSFWSRYLEVFDSVRIVARVRDVAVSPPGLRPINRGSISFTSVPDYLGPEQYLLRVTRVAAATAKAVQNGDAVILRVPGRIGTCVESHLRKMRRPYGVEVVGDPYDVFAPGGVEHPLRPLFRWWFARNLRRQCSASCAAAYVTKYALQRRYPPAPEAFATSCSDVELPPTAYVNIPRTATPAGTVRLVFVGSLAQLYKAPDVLIDAVGDCVGNGLDVELIVLGSGRFQLEVEARAMALGLGSRIQFRGQVTTPEAVRMELDQAHLFVLPSRVEGLPRAMIEAMARALPCIGSTIGGIPELIAEEDRVAPGDAPALARKIREVITDPARMALMSARNLTKAREYSDTSLTSRRKAFYQHLKTCTESWLQRKP